LVVPRTLFGRSATRGPALVISFTRTSRPAAQNGGRSFACSSRWIRPCFSGSGRSDSSSSPGTPRGSNSSRHALEPTPRAFLSDCSPRVRGIMRSTPQRYFSHSRQVPIGTFVKFALSGLFRPVLRPRNSLPNQADSSSFRSPPKAGGVVDSGALLGATGGTQTHSRRTGRKLGRLRYARQGLVRVPESNTKYGGQGGKTGGSAAPVIDPSIGES